MGRELPGVHDMRKILLAVVFVVLFAGSGWGATYYGKKIAGTIYYKAAEWPIDTDTSAVSLQALVNAVDNGGHTLVLDPGSAWTGAGCG